MKDVPTILVDQDGVLTDGRLHMDHTGEKLFKSYHTRDVRAIRELVSLGFEVVIVTADDHPTVFKFAEKVGAVVEVVRDKGELPQRYGRFIAVGDDVWDVPMLTAARFAYAPSNAFSVVKEIRGIRIVECMGGEGVMAHVLQDVVQMM